LELDFRRHYDFYPHMEKHVLPGPTVVHSKATYLQLIADVAEKGKSHHAFGGCAYFGVYYSGSSFND